MISLSDHGRRQSVGFPGLTPVSTRHGPPAIPIAPLHHAPKVLTLLRNRCSRCSGIRAHHGPAPSDRFGVIFQPRTAWQVRAGRRPRSL